MPPVGVKRRAETDHVAVRHSDDTRDIPAVDDTRDIPAVDDTRDIPAVDDTDDFVGQLPRLCLHRCPRLR
jgi:hypothetical protein